MIIAMTMSRPTRAAINVPRQLRMRRTEDSELFIAVGVQAGKIKSCPVWLGHEDTWCARIPTGNVSRSGLVTCNTATRVQLCPVRHTPFGEVLAAREFGVRIQSNSGAVPIFFPTVLLKGTPVLNKT